MHFVLDANIVISEGFGASAHLRALLSASSAVGYKVYFPKPVLEEIAAKYSRDLASNARKASDSLGTLSRLLGRDLNSSVDGFDPKAETALFQDRLLAQLSASESEILEYPCTPHEDLVRKATSRKRPFDEKGSGYRDALVWQIVLELATQVEGNIVLVSKDKDFRDEDGNLHGDLIEDLENLGLPRDKVILATELSDLVDKYVRPNLGTVPWERPLQILAQLGLNLEDSIGLLVQDACIGREWEPSELGIPWEYESPTLDMVEGVSDLTVVDVRELPHSQFLVKTEAKIYGDFGVFVHKPDWYVLHDSRLHVDEFDWNDHYVRAGITLPLQCELNLVVDASDPEQPEVRDVSVELETVDF